MALINNNLIRAIVTNNSQSLVAQSRDDTRFSDSISLVKRWIADKQQQAVLLEEVLSPLLNDPDILGDVTEIVFKNFDNDSDTDFISEITTSTFDDVMNGYDVAASRWSEVYGSQLNNQGFTMSDSNGYCYTFRKGSWDILCHDGAYHTVVGLSYVTDPHDYHDMFLYRYDDVSYVNSILKSVGYFRVDGSMHVLNDIWSILDEIADLVSYEQVHHDILSYIKGIASSNSLNIMDASIDLCSKFSVTPSNTLVQNLNAVVSFLRQEWTESNSGIRQYVGDVFRAVAVNSSLIDVYSYICDGLYSNTLESSIGNLKFKYRDATSTIQDVINDVMDAYSRGGFYGLVSYFISIIQGEASVSTTGDQLKFSDASSVTPAQYIAGIVMTVVGTVGQMASFIVMYANKVAGIALNIISGILLAIPKAIGWEYTQNTLAAVNDASEVIIDCCPHATLQQQFSVTDLYGAQSKAIYDLIVNNNSTVYAQVPGGYLFIGKGDADSTLRTEFHPSSRVVSFNKISEAYTANEVQKSGSYHKCVNIAITRRNLDPDVIYKAWTIDYANSKSLNNADNGTLSEIDDSKLRYAVLCNTSVFYMWLFLLNKGPVLSSLFGKWLSFKWSDWSGNAWEESWLDFTLDPNHILAVFADRCYWPNRTYTNMSGLSWTDIAGFFSTENSRSDELKIYGWISNVGNIYPDGDDDVIEIYDTQTIVDRICNYNNSYYGSIVTTPSKYSYYFATPKYERSTFIAWVALTTFVTLVAAVTVAVTTIRVKRALQNKRAKLTSRVSNNWDNYTNAMKDYDPDDEDDRPEYHTAEARKAAYSKYYKSVRKNNRWQLLLGGTRYSTAGYWDVDESVSAYSEDGKSFFTTIKDSIGGQTDTFNDKTDVPENYSTEILIYEAITGKS